MDNWILYFVQVNLYVILLGLCYSFGFKTQNFKFNRPFLLIGSTLAFLLPLLKFSNAAQFTAAIQLEGILINTYSNVLRPSTSFSINWLFVVQTILLGGILLKFIHLLFGIYKLQKLKNTTNQRDNYFEVPNSFCAFSFMSSIFIGDQIPSEKRETILKHEQVHSQRKHSIDIIFSQLISCILWYNPMSYRIINHLKEVHEFEADYSASENRTEYIELLLQQNFQNFNISLLHQFNSNHIKNRIMRLKEKNNPRTNPLTIGFTLIAFSLLFVFNQGTIAQTVKKSTYTTSEKFKVDSYAVYKGGNEALLAFIAKNLEYPEKMKTRNIEATVYTELLIDANGNVETYKFLKTTNILFEEAIIEVIKKLKKFTPAQKDGKAVKSTMTLPIKFRLNNKPPPPPPPLPPTPPSNPKK